MTNRVKSRFVGILGVGFVLLIAAIFYFNQRIVARLDDQPRSVPDRQNISAPAVSEGAEKAGIVPGMPKTNDGPSGIDAGGGKAQPVDQEIIREAPLKDVILVQ